nr:MAG TPA: hypothetical protein [Caudoviricetes sp.]
MLIRLIRCVLSISHRPAVCAGLVFVKHLHLNGE